MIIAQISDTHIALDTPDADQRMRDFELTIADINALDPAPDVIVHTGDIVHNGRQDEYAQASATLAKARAPVYVLAGNKDNRANLRAAFSACGYLAPDSDFIDYAIDDYPVRLIALDTLSSGSNKGDFCRERVSHLIDMIDAETTKPIAVFTHHPPFEVPVGPDPHPFRNAGDDVEAAPGLATLRAGRRRLQRPCSPCCCGSCREHPGDSGAVHRDDTAQRRVSGSHEELSGLSHPPI